MDDTTTQNTSQTTTTTTPPEIDITFPPSSVPGGIDMTFPQQPESIPGGIDIEFSDTDSNVIPPAEGARDAKNDFDKQDDTKLDEETDEETDEDTSDGTIPLTQTKQKKPGLVQRAKNLFSGPPPAISKERLAELNATSARAGAIAYNNYRQSAKKAAEAREIKEAAKKKAAVDTEAAKIAGKGQTPAGTAGTSGNEVKGPFDPFTGEPLPTVDERRNAVELTPEKQEEMRKLLEEAGLDLGSPVAAEAGTPPVAAEAATPPVAEEGSSIPWGKIPTGDDGEPISLEEWLDSLPSSEEMYKQLPDEKDDETIDPEKNPEKYKERFDSLIDINEKLKKENYDLEQQHLKPYRAIRDKIREAKQKAKKLTGLAATVGLPKHLTEMASLNLKLKQIQSQPQVKQALKKIASNQKIYNELIKRTNLLRAKVPDENSELASYSPYDRREYQIHPTPWSVLLRKIDYKLDSFSDATLKAVNPQTGDGFPQQPEPFRPGAEPPDVSERESSPQTMSLSEAAQKNFVKQVQNASTGNTNFVINHGRLHANGYRLLKEGKEVRSRVISAKKENLYIIQADSKLVGAAPSTVKDDFAADPTNPQFQAQPGSTTAFDDAKAYIEDLVDQGLLGEKVDQKSVENYAKALAGMLPSQSDGTNPNDITVELLRKKIEENSGTEVASALFNADPDDKNHVDIDSFVKQIRGKRSAEEKTEGKSEKQEQVADKDRLEAAARDVLPPGFIIHGIDLPKNLRSNRAKLVQQFGLPFYEAMATGFVQRMMALQLKHLGIPVSNLQDFFDAISAKDSVGNFTHFNFIKDSFVKLGYSNIDASKKAEYFLSVVSDKTGQQYYLLSASGINRNMTVALNLYKQADGSVNAEQLYAKGLEDQPSADPTEVEDPKQLEREKSVLLKQALHKQYLTNEEMEYGVLHILQKPAGYKYLTLDMDRVENLEDHISRKNILAMKNDGILDAFFAALAKIETISTSELQGKFDIKPSTLKHLDIAIEEAKSKLFDVIKNTPTGPKINPEEYAEHMLELYIAKMRAQVLLDLKAMGMKSTNFDKDKIADLIDIRRNIKLGSKARGLLDWANGDIEPEKDYPMVTDAGIAERQQQLAHVFAKPEDFKHADYEKIKELHKQMFMIGSPAGAQNPVDQGKVAPTASSDELSAEIANAVESSLSPKDLNILKLSKDVVYEINNAYIEMSQLKESPSDLESKRNSLEKFLASRGLTPAGAKSAADAVLNTVKGLNTGGLTVGSASPRAEQNQETSNGSSVQSPQTSVPSVEKIMQSLEGKGIRKIPKGVQGDLERLKTYLDVNGANLSESEVQTLFTHFNPPPPQFSFDAYAKSNPERFTTRGDKVYMRVAGKEIPVPENLKSSEADLMKFIKENEDKENEIKAQKLQQVQQKVKSILDRIDSIGKLKKQDKKELIKQLVEAGMNEAEATLMVENAISEKLPVLQAKVQAKLKGLENSAKVRNIFTSDGKSLSSQEIASNMPGLSAAVLSEISDYFVDDREALQTAEKIVTNKYKEAVEFEKLLDLEEQLGIKPKNGKPGNAGELDLAIAGTPTKVKVRKVDDGYILSSESGAEIQIPKEQLIASGKVDYDLIASELEARTPADTSKSDSKKESLEESTAVKKPEGSDLSTPVEVTGGVLKDPKSVASGIMGAILSGKPVRLSASLSGLNEDSWMDLSEALAKSKTFKKLKLPASVADDIVLRLTSANPDELEFDLTEFLKPQTEEKLERDEFGNIIRKSLFSMWESFLVKSLSPSKTEEKDFAYEMVIKQYVDTLKMAGEFNEIEQAKILKLVEDLESRGITIDVNSILD